MLSSFNWVKSTFSGQLVVRVVVLYCTKCIYIARCVLSLQQLYTAYLPKIEKMLQKLMKGRTVIDKIAINSIPLALLPPNLAEMFLAKCAQSVKLSFLQ